MSSERGFFQQIQNTYGRNVVQLLKSWISINKKLAALKNRRIFLLQCRQKNIFPNHITNNMKCLYSLKSERHPYLKEIDNVLYKFKKSVLNVEIKITIWKLNNAETELNCIKNTTVELLPNDIFTNFSIKCQIGYNKMFNSIKQKNLNKISHIYCKQATFELETHDTFLYNYTNITLPLEVKKILCAGPKFTLPYNSSEIPIPNIIKDLEHCINAQTIDDEAKSDLRSVCVNSITNFVSRVEHSNLTRSNHIIKDFILTRDFLKSHPELLIMCSDKGNSTVVMYKDEYISGMNELLTDRLTYTTLASDPTVKYQNQANKLIKQLVSEGYIDDMSSKRLIKHNTVSPKLYGLRKTHKPGISLRPVVSCINSPSYDLATFVHQILAQVTTTFQFNIKNSFEFVEFIKRVTLPPNCLLVSLDVTSLFTNIPRDLVLSIIKKKWRFISAYTSLSQDLFCKLINFLFDSSYFSFNGRVYQQLDGSAMGNPASPVLANLVMNELLLDVLHKLPFDLPFIKLYVDDTLLACPVDRVSQLLGYFNDFHNKINFTMEVETGGQIPFLDALIIHNADDSLSTNWYIKPTSSGRVVNYLSTHAYSQKIATVKNLLYRSYHLSSPMFHKENEIKIKNILKNNNYPIALVNRIINEYRHKLNQDKQDKPNKVYFRFPYLQGLSERLQRHIRAANPQCVLAFYNIKTIKQLFSKLKDRTPLELCSGVVYRVPCAGCDKCYVGQTRQYIKTRMYQHQYDCRDINRLKKDKTALAQHHFYTGHHFDFSKVAILDKEGHYYRRNVSEMIHITLNNTVNNRTDTQGLSTQYNFLIRKFKTLSGNSGYTN